MKKLLIITFVLSGMSMGINAQSKKQEPILSDIQYVLKGSMMATVPWHAYYVDKLKFPLTTPVDIEQVLKDLDAYLVALPTGDNKGTYTDNQFSIIKKYKEEIVSTFEKFNTMRPFKVTRFFYNNNIPGLINIVVKNNNDLSLVVAGGDIDMLFDRKTRTAEERPQIILANYILPSLKVMADNFSGDDFKYFGMTIVYGTFWGDETYRPEWVSFVAPASAIRKYATGKMTTEALINTGETHISDSADMTKPARILNLKYSHISISKDIEHPNTVQNSKADVSISETKPLAISQKAEYIINDLEGIYTSMPGDNYDNPYHKDTVVHLPCHDTLYIDKAMMRITGIVKNKKINLSIMEIEHRANYDRYSIKNTNDIPMHIELYTEDKEIKVFFPLFGIKEKASVLTFK
ncbi:MAG: hypothetical protein ABI378_09210 [Chitinophagaceae bacterium]